MSILNCEMRVIMADGTVIAVPVDVIAKNRAAHYAHEFGGDLQRSLEEDTVPMFEDDHYEIEDWAANNMDWADVAHTARLVSNPNTDYQDGWVNGDKEIFPCGSDT